MLSDSNAALGRRSLCHQNGRYTFSTLRGHQSLLFALVQVTFDFEPRHGRGGIPSAAFDDDFSGQELRQFLPSTIGKQAAE